MRTPKENKQKPRDRTPKSTAGTIPKASRPKNGVDKNKRANPHRRAGK